MVSPSLPAPVRGELGTQLWARAGRQLRLLQFVELGVGEVGLCGHPPTGGQPPGSAQRPGQSVRPPAGRGCEGPGPTAYNQPCSTASSYGPARRGNYSTRYDA